MRINTRRAEKRAGTVRENPLASGTLILIGQVSIQKPSRSRRKFCPTSLRKQTTIRRLSASAR